jgi:hypothetical protein
MNSFFTCICWVPLVITYPLETVTTKQRSLYFATTLFAINVTAFIGSYMNSVGITNIGWHYYIPTCIWNAMLFAIIYFTFVETKGMTLEEIATLFDGAEDFQSTAAAIAHDLDKNELDSVTHHEQHVEKLSHN